MRIILTIALTLSTTAAFAADGCHVDSWRIVWGQDSQATMTEKSGMPCTIHMNDYAGVRSAVIARQPANGTAWISDNHHWGYKSRPGYTGADTFTVAVDGSGNARHGAVISGTSNLLVNVSVGP